MVLFQKRVKNEKSLTKMVPFQKRVTNPQRNGKNSSTEWYHFRQKRVKNRQQNGTISENDQTSSTKMVPFQKRVKNPRQKWYHFRKGSKILDKNGAISVRKGS